MPTHTGRRRAPLALLAAMLPLYLVIAACGTDDDATAPTTTSAESTTTSAETTTTETTTTTTSTTTTDAEPVPETQVRIYLLRGETLGVASRTVPAEAPLGEAITATLAGPDATEQDLGLGTAIPEGTELRSLAVDDGVAVVDLSGEFAAGGGSLSMQARVAQVVFALTQYPDVADRVTIWLDGEQVDAIGGEGVPATELTRADFAAVTPSILVESPAPGDVVPTPFELTGTANVFEGNVVYSLATPEGTVLDEGFTTASARDIGQWGPFSVTVDTGATGPAVLEVYWISPQDGAREDLVTVPLELG